MDQPPPPPPRGSQKDRDNVACPEGHRSTEAGWQRSLPGRLETALEEQELELAFAQRRTLRRGSCPGKSLEV